MLTIYYNFSEYYLLNFFNQNVLTVKEIYGKINYTMRTHVLTKYAGGALMFKGIRFIDIDGELAYDDTTQSLNHEENDSSVKSENICNHDPLLRTS